MLESGTTAHDYEPYTNGASPNPTYPQDINVVTGTQEVKVENVNLFKFSSENFYKNSLTTSNIVNANKLEVTTSGSAAYGNTSFKLDLPNGTYTFSLGNVTNTNSNMTTKRMTLSKYIGTTRSVVQHIDMGTPRSVTITNASDTQFVLEFWASYSTSLSNTATFEQVQVEPGSTASSYIEHQEQTKTLHLSSKNLFDKDNYNIAYGYTDSQYKLINGNNTTTTDKGFWAKLKPNTTYTLTISKLNAGTDKMFAFYNVPPNTSDIYASSTLGRKMFSTDATSFSYTFTTDSTYIYIHCKFYKTTNTTDTTYTLEEMLESIMLNEGSTALPYEPYYNYELSKIGTYQDRIFESSGKNLANVDETQIGKAWNNASNNARAILVLPIKHNTQYTISYRSLGSLEGIYYGYRTEETTAGTGVTQMSTTSLTITTNDTNNYIVFQFNKTSISLADIQAINLMLNEGSTALPYEPYGSDKWYIEKNIGKYAINGASGTFTKPSTNRFNIDGALTDYLKAINVVTCMSDKYVSYEQKATNSDFNTLVANVNYGIELSSSNSAFTIRIKDTNYDDVNQYKTWLASNNVELLYVLATPTYTEITNTTLIEELNELEKMMSYNGQTNISVSGNLPMILDVSALKGESE